MLIAYLYDDYLNDSVKDTRTYTTLIEKIKEKSTELQSKTNTNEIIRYVLYTESETVYRNELTGAYLGFKESRNYTIEDIHNLRRLKNVKYIYEHEFNNNGIIKKGNYILIKVINNNQLRLRAYISKDPTINEITDFWYNGHYLKSIKTGHTFDALTGKGISNNKSMTPIMIEEEIREN